MLFRLDHEKESRIPEIHVGLDGRIEGWNAGAEALYGYAAMEAVGKTVDILYPVELIQSHEVLFELVFNGESGQEHMAMHRSKEGREFQVYYTLQPFVDEDGRLMGLRKVITRVTERAEDKVAFWESATWIRAVVDSAVDSIVVINERGLIAYVNPACEKIFGYTLEELIGQNVSVLMPADHSVQHDQYIGNYLETGKRHVIGIGREVDGRHKTGTLIPLHLSVSEAQIGGRRVFTGILRDISDTLRSLEEQGRLLLALRERNKKLACLYAVYEIIRTTEVESTCFQAIASRVPAACTAPEQVATRITYDGKSYVSDAFRTTDLVLSESIVVGGRPRGAIELFLEQEEGANDFSVEDREMVQSIARTLGETEERREAESQVIQASKLASIGELAAGVSHEINNPINGIINCADILAENLAKDETSLRFARLIRSEADRIAMIVRNLLTFSRHEAQTPSLAHLSDIMDVVLSLVHKTLQKSLIYLIVEIPEDLPRIRCRSEQLHQVLMNLIINAVHALDERFPHGDPDKRLILRAHAHSAKGRESVRLIVEDHGAGVQPEYMDRLFDPFFTTKGRDKGTGLGLSVSSGIVKAHEGTITAESKVGLYTRFTIDLPVVRLEQANEAPDAR